MPLKENLYSILEKNTTAIGIIGALSFVSVLSEKDRLNNLTLILGLAFATIAKDYLMIEAEKHAEALGAGLASTLGKTTLAINLGSGILEGKFTAVIGISAAMTGIIDSVQNINHIKSIVRKNQPDLPSWLPQI